MTWKEKVCYPLLVAEILMIILFSVFGSYAEEFDVEKYAMFQDVHVMIFIGFGYLMTFLKRYGFGSLGFTLLLASFIIQWALICQGFYGLNETYKIELGIESLYQADIAAATILISMGALVGRASVTQLIVMGFIEIAVYCANAHLGTHVLKVADAGGSIFVHTFGAYFGLAVSYVINRAKEGKPETSTSLQKSNYTSDMFAMIGTVFLWLFWPSFTSIEVEGIQMQRAIINTYLALASCCVTAYAFSAMLSHEKKFDMVHVQNSTLAGGVAIGTVVNLLVQPGGAVAVGVAAGALSVFGYVKLSPLLEEKFKIPDVCGVHNLHGMPGVLSGVLGAIMASIATKHAYEDSLYEIYPAMLGNGTLSGENGGRHAGVQGWYQLAALGATLLIAITSGLLTGTLLSKLPSHLEYEFNDALYWEMPEEEEVEVKRIATIEENALQFRGKNQYDNMAFEHPIGNVDH